jgi:hypothetical protein|nr:MAG TPA: hypothetical protein [Caudoviricetes sp.]
MKMTDKTIRQGVSEISGFRLDYTITYIESIVCKVEAEIRRVSSENTPEKHIGYALNSLEPLRYTFQITAEAVTAEERRTLIDDFEKTIKELME